MTTKPQIHSSFLKNLSIYYYFLFFLLNSVAKKIYEILATNFDKLCKTNPICGKTQINVTSVTLNNYEESRPPTPPKTNPIQSQSKPIQTQFAGRPKMNVTKALTKDYENKPPQSRGKNKPNDPSCINAAQFSPSLCYGAGLFSEIGFFESMIFTIVSANRQQQLRFGSCPSISARKPYWRAPGVPGRVQHRISSAWRRCHLRWRLLSAHRGLQPSVCKRRNHHRRFLHLSCCHRQPAG